MRMVDTCEVEREIRIGATPFVQFLDKEGEVLTANVFDAIDSTWLQFTNTVFKETDIRSVLVETVFHDQVKSLLQVFL